MTSLNFYSDEKCRKFDLRNRLIFYCFMKLINFQPITLHVCITCCLHIQTVTVLMIFWEIRGDHGKCPDIEVSYWFYKPNFPSFTIYLILQKDLKNQIYGEEE